MSYRNAKFEPTPVGRFAKSLASAMLLGVMACNSGTFPTAPSGAILSIDANPKTISVTGSSVVTVTARDGETGVPLRAGTEIRLATDLGTIEELVITDGDGVARATLQADGREGMATVTARSGLGSSSQPPPEVSTQVTIGQAMAEPLRAVFTAVTNETTLAVFFDDSSTGFPTSWEWDFGDGSPKSGEREPTHLYEAAGSYVVSLTVRDPDSQDTASAVVTVPKEAS